MRWGLEASSWSHLFNAVFNPIILAFCMVFSSAAPTLSAHPMVNRIFTLRGLARVVVPCIVFQAFIWFTSVQIQRSPDYVHYNPWEVRAELESVKMRAGPDAQVEVSDRM